MKTFEIYQRETGRGHVWKSFFSNYPVDLGLQEANNLRCKLCALRQHRQRVDRVLGGIVHHGVDLRVELA